MHDNGAQEGRESDHDHVQAKVDANIGHLVGGRRHQVGQEQQQEKEAREDVHAENDFGGILGRQPEHGHGEEGEQHARKYKQVGVEARVASHDQEVREHRVVLVLEDSVGLLAVESLAVDLPLLAALVVVQIDLVLVVVKVQVKHAAVVGPRAERERAVLLVERKHLEIDEASAGEDRARDPQQFTVAVYDQQGLAFVL